MLDAAALHLLHHNSTASSPAAEPETGGAAAGSRGAPDTLRVIIFPGTADLVLHAAEQRGILAQHNLAMELTATVSSKMQMEGVLEGAWDIAHTAVDNVIAYNQERGADFAMYYGIGATTLHFFVQPHIQSFEELKGKDFAVDAISTGFAFVLQRILHENGVGPGDYQLVSIGGTKQRYEAMKANQELAGTLLTPPFIGMGIREGFKDMGEVTRYIPNYASTVGAARRSWAAQRHDVLIRWVRAQKQATDWVLNPANKDAAVDLLAQRLDLATDLARRSFDEVILHPQLGLYAAAALPTSGIDTVLALRAEMGFLNPATAKAEEFYDLSIYNQAVG